MFEFLDYPRQSLANLGRGAYRAATGEATGDDLLGMMPGLAGGAALAAGMNPLIAALVGGGMQGAGKLGGYGAFDAPTTGDLVGGLGGDPNSPVQNIAAHLLTDPLSYAAAGPVTRAARAPWRTGAALEAELGQLGRVTGDLDSAIASQQAHINQFAGPAQINQIANPLQALDLEGIAGGATMTRAPGRLHAAKGTAPPVWARQEPAAQELVNAGWGRDIPTGGAPELELYGSHLPPGVEMRRLSDAGRMVGMGPVVPPTYMDMAQYPEALAQEMAVTYAKPRTPIGVTFPAGTVPRNMRLMPHERQYMMDMQQAGVVPNNGPAIAHDLAVNRLGGEYGALMDETAGGLVPDILHRPSPLDALGMPTMPLGHEAAHMGPREGSRMLHGEMGALNRRLGRYRMTEADLLQLLAGAGSGSYAGGMLGFNDM